MTAPKGPLELVSEEVMRIAGPELTARFEQLTPIIAKAIQRGIPIEQVDIPPAAEPVKAGTAAKRTTLQGVVAVSLGSVFGYLADAVSDEKFQVFDLGSWQGVGTGAITAGTMAILAFGMRKIGR